jgi:hypothetical protein
MCQFRASPGDGSDLVLVKPDGFLRIREQDAACDLYEHTFFLELDRSTESQQTLLTKACCYIDYYRSGGLAERFGHRREEFKDFLFRLLTVFKWAERRNNTADALLSLTAPILTQVWLTTLSEAVADPLGSIWVRPVDYRQAIEGTPFAAIQSAPRGYRRQSRREETVERAVRKHRIIEQSERQ